MNEEFEQLVEKYKKDFLRKMADRAQNALDKMVLSHRAQPLERIEQLLTAGLDPNGRDGNGRTPLMVAAENCFGEMEAQALRVMRSLLERGAEANARDYWDRSAIYEGGNSALRLLLEYGADPNIVTKRGNTPLIAAVRRRSLSDAEVLLAGGARCSGWPIGHTSAMHWAIHTQQLDIVRLFLEHGADVAEVDRRRQSLLHWVQWTHAQNTYSESGRLAIAKLLIQHGAPCDLADLKGNTALHIAVIESRSEEMMRLLVDNGVPIDAVNYAGKTARDLAQECEIEASVGILDRPIEGKKSFAKEQAERKLQQIIQLEELLQAGGDPNSRNDFRRTPLMTAVDNCSEPHQARALEVIRLLLERGADVDARDEGGDTALFEASGASLKLLLAHGADPNLVGPSGDTPLTQAVVRGSLSDIRALLASGAKCSDWPFGRSSAMTIAIRKGSLEIVKLFIEHGANLNEVDRDGQGLLYWTLDTCKWIEWAESDRLEMAKLLVDSGAPCDWTDLHGRTALHAAARNERSEEMMRFLIANGVSLHAADYRGETALDEARDWNRTQSAAILEQLAREK